MHISLVALASKNALATSLIMIALPAYPSVSLSTVAASCTKYRSASKGGVPANNPAISLSLNSFPTTLLR
eukprot:9531598-Karenia_brevis.AAC.1